MKKRLLIFFVISLCFFVGVVKNARGVSCVSPPNNASLEDLQAIENECLRLLNEAHSTADTLKKQIGLMGNQIRLTTLKISQTGIQIKDLEKEISVLTGKIGKLEEALNYLSKVLLSRVAETYKEKRFPTIFLLFSSRGFGDFLRQYRYLQKAQINDRQLLISTEQTRANYKEQKGLKEKAQVDLEKLNKQLLAQRQLLATQIADQNRLLDETKGKETEYQKLLAATRQELEAIQQIIAGKGQEEKVGEVGESSRIASVIYGASACSTGTHLHFEVRKNGELQNPFSLLRSISLIDQSGGDSHNASGGWSWPLSEPVKFNQGYGAGTSAIRSHLVWYNFHTGIDIVSDNRTVKAVSNGTLYRGGVKCGSGTLRYVRLDHKDSDYDTYYLHVDY